MGQSLIKSKPAPSGASMIVRVGLIAFAAGLMIMFALSYFSTAHNQPTMIFASAVLLAAVVAPTVYAFVIGPLTLAYEEHGGGAAATQPSVPAALTDPVTQLPNRRGITSNLLEFMAHAERYNTPLSIALVQVQDFKKLGDDTGPRGGDKLLQIMAEVFYDTLRMPDKAGRYDGEEFLVVLPHTKLKDASMIAERIRNSAAGKKAKLQVIIGAIQFRKGEDLEQLLSRAEAAKGAKPAPRRVAKKPAK